MTIAEICENTDIEPEFNSQLFDVKVVSSFGSYKEGQFKKGSDMIDGISRNEFNDTG